MVLNRPPDPLPKLPREKTRLPGFCLECDGYKGEENICGSCGQCYGFLGECGHGPNCKAVK